MLGRIRLRKLLLFTVACLGTYLLLSDPHDRNVTYDEEEVIKELEDDRPVQQVAYSPFYKRSEPTDTHKNGGRNNVNLNEISAIQETYYTQLWKWAKEAVTQTELFPETRHVDLVTNALATAKIMKVDVVDLGEYESGTSMKWMITLEGGQKAVVKIVWEKKGLMKADALCNYGFEMPSAEIAAYHLHRVVGFRNTPYVSGRKINLRKEILPVASPIVAQQIFQKEGMETCVVGSCYLCKEQHHLCTTDGIIEASVAYWVNQPLQLHTFPPKYMPFSTPSMNIWEAIGFNNDSYCQDIRKTMPPYEQDQFYYDLFDFAIIDTLMYHYDSKHYVVSEADSAKGLRVRLDHGRAFCAYDRDDIKLFLAPLTQCCTLRNSTWKKLQRFKSIKLSQIFRESLNQDPISPVLQDPWDLALDRRYDIIMDTVERCAEARNGLENVLVNDEKWVGRNGRGLGR